LPESLGGEGEAKNSWICEFESGDLEASLTVAVEDVWLSDDDGETIEINDDNCEDILHGITGGETDNRRITLMPRGSIVRDDIFEEGKESDPADWRNGRCRVWLWRYVLYGNGDTRMAEVRLISPVDQAETPELEYLTRLLDKSVREAEFPGINDAADEADPI
jgi:hypothetical protein